MKTLNLTAGDALAIASLSATVASKSDAKMTPVLGEILLTVSNGTVTAYATDRFCLSRYTGTGDGVDGELRLTPEIAKFLLTNVKKGRGHSPENVELIYSEEAREVSARYGLAVAGDVWTSAKYPPVSNVLDTWTARTDNMPVTLRAEFLARLGKFINAFRKVELWVLTIGAGSEYHPDKPGPILAKSGPFEVLIQPNLLTNV